VRDWRVGGSKIHQGHRQRFVFGHEGEHSHLDKRTKNLTIKKRDFSKKRIALGTGRGEKQFLEKGKILT